MKISTRIERIDESLIAGKFSKNTQLDLRIVSNDQLSSFGMPHEATTILEGVRDLLNIWIRAGEAAGRRANLAKVRVQPASFGVDELNHILAITGQRLLHRAVLEQLRYHRILSCQRL